MEIVEIQRQCLEDSERWFPGTAHSLGYMAIALTGEVGEFCNLFKKIERGTVEHNEDSHTELALELCDIFIYLCNMAAIMNVSLEQMYHLKRDFNEKRFGASSPDHTDGDAGSDEYDSLPNGAASFMSVSEVSKPLQGGS